jgi:hypothetical protein
MRGNTGIEPGPRRFLPLSKSPLPGRARNTWFLLALTHEVLLCLKTLVSLHGTTRILRLVPTMKKHEILSPQASDRIRRANRPQGIRAVRCLNVRVESRCVERRATIGVSWAHTVNPCWRLPSTGALPIFSLYSKQKLAHVGSTLGGEQGKSDAFNG